MKTKFFEPMECLSVAHIPEGDQWTYELKLDGYRLEAVRAEEKVTLYSRRGNGKTTRFDYVGEALLSIPDDTVIDDELVAMDEQSLKKCKSAADRRTETHKLPITTFTPERH